jgi:LAO/AO transport system kinase
MESWVEAIKRRDRRALAKAITCIESTHSKDLEEVKKLFIALGPPSKVAHRIGVTGIPGVGKSTFLAAITQKMLQQHPHTSVAILTVDPSSPLHGGSILGDRTRMSALESYPNVYIRTTPSGSGLGGLSRRTHLVVALLEAAGFESIWIESVGVGQNEVDISGLVDTVILLHMPATGDDVQAMKKGVNEVCDMIVVHKADGSLKPIAEQTVRALRLQWQGSAQSPQVLPASSYEEQSLAEVLKNIEDHLQQRWQAPSWSARRALQARKWLEHEMIALLQDSFKEKNWQERVASYAQQKAYPLSLDANLFLV